MGVGRITRHLHSKRPSFSKGFLGLPESTAASKIKLFPYRIFSCNSVFGDVELVAEDPRYASARCESSRGTLLILDKASFFQLSEEFPQFGAAWKVASKRREMMRKRLLKTLTRGRTYQVLAAVTIQRFAKAHLRQHHKAHSQRSSSSSPAASVQQDGDSSVVANVVGKYAQKIHTIKGSASYMTLQNRASDSQVQELQNKVDSLLIDVDNLRRDIRAGFEVLSVRTSKDRLST